MLKQFLQDRLGDRVSVPDDLVLEISDNLENHSSITINFDFDEIRVGIGNVLEYYSKEKVEEGIKRFLKLLTYKIRRTDFIKGELNYKSRFEIIKDGQEHEFFGESMTWLYPYWKKDTIKSTVQVEFLRVDELEDAFKLLKLSHIPQV